MTKRTTAKTVSAQLEFEINVYCPECGKGINLLDARDTDGVNHNSDGELTEQIRQSLRGDGAGFHFLKGNVTCTLCKTNFNVHGLGLCL